MIKVQFTRRLSISQKLLLTVAIVGVAASIGSLGTFATFTHPVRGELTIPGNVIKLSDSNVPVVSPPLLGADNDAVYGGLLGLTKDEIEELRKKKAI